MLYGIYPSLIKNTLHALLQLALLLWAIQHAKIPVLEKFYTYRFLNMFIYDRTEASSVGKTRSQEYVPQNNLVILLTILPTANIVT